MFAVIKTGGKQYRVAAGDTITVEKLAGDPGEVIAFEQVLMLVNDAATEIGAPSVPGVTVAGELVEQTRGAKVIAFKKRRRKNSRRKRGHRQDLTIVRITEILTGGARPDVKARAKQPAAAPQDSKAEEPAAELRKHEEASKPKPKKAPAETKPQPEAKSETPSTADHDHSGIAARGAASIEAAKAKGIDIGTFRKLEQPVGEADDLKLISGVGPAIEKKMNGAGIWHYWQVKALSEDDIAKIEQEVGLKGRAHRDEWVEQAADLLAGKGPRHKA
ncbi:MAG: 50S ribosomal protein L21 [Hyphomicrobiales bacterium]|nr:50S ribosomal protein L21 [Hyphomicrobiales bacterium]MBV8770116.1 50S ribosomal protein L21 [Hyphomicrobiales bacterium]MBV9052952.1 50S ribosomal protein L21 [Hyphomicrobiales bacterium]MBV9588254.1 50S ribosomal protein L21 [Hyphomicrobiales bacterium]MBV9975106.1 50S ribosomal protein L21 [Hyphomicrobiales bacterium]